MTSMIFNILYDVLWFVFIYGFMYKAVDFLFREYAQVVKILFDINVRLFNYSTELNAKERHEILFTVATVFAFTILTINPFAHCLLYGIVMNMVDVVDLNRILLYILLFKIAKNINLISGQISLRTEHANVLCQIVYLLLNYHNVQVAVPVLFQVIDETSSLNYFFRSMLAVHDYLFNSDTWVKSKILTVSVILEGKQLRIIDTKLILLGIIVFISFLYSKLSTVGEVAFYYYSVARMAHAFVTERPVAKLHR